MAKSETMLKKLLDIVETWLYDGKPPTIPNPRRKVPPVYCKCLALAYNELVRRGETVTSWEPVVIILQRCGFRGEHDEYGITWRFYLE